MKSDRIKGVPGDSPSVSQRQSSLHYMHHLQPRCPKPALEDYSTPHGNQFSLFFFDTLSFFLYFKCVTISIRIQFLTFWPIRLENSSALWYKMISVLSDSLQNPIEWNLGDTLVSNYSNFLIKNAHTPCVWNCRSRIKAWIILTCLITQQSFGGRELQLSWHQLGVFWLMSAVTCNISIWVRLIARSLNFHDVGQDFLKTSLFCSQGHFQLSNSFHWSSPIIIPYLLVYLCVQWNTCCLSVKTWWILFLIFMSTEWI